MKNNSVLIAGLFFAHLGCSNPQRLDTAEVKDEMEGHKVKRVTPAQIIEQVETLGSRIAIDLTKDLEEKIKTVPAEKAEEICGLKNLPMVDSVSKKYNLKVRLLGKPDMNSNKNLYSKEKEVLEAYADAAAQKQTLSNNIQSIGDSLFIYTAPIGADKGAGKLCFSDESGFAVWSIIMKKQDVVKSIKPGK